MSPPRRIRPVHTALKAVISVSMYWLGIVGEVEVVVREILERVRLGRHGHSQKKQEKVVEVAFIALLTSVISGKGVFG